MTLFKILDYLKGISNKRIGFKPCRKWLHKEYGSRCGKPSPFGDFTAYCSVCYQLKEDWDFYTKFQDGELRMYSNSY